MGCALRLRFCFYYSGNNAAHVNWSQLFNDFTVGRFGPKDVSWFAIWMSKPILNRERKEEHCVARQRLVLWHFKVAIVVIKALMIQSLEIRRWVIPWCYSCAWVELRCNFLHSFCKNTGKSTSDPRTQLPTFKLSCVKTWKTSLRAVRAQALSIRPKVHAGLKLLNLPIY